MFDDDDRRPCIDETLKHAEEHPDIDRMQPHAGFIEDEQCPVLVPLEIGDEFQPLRLAAGQCRWADPVS
ncbi:hypothetical protein GCM10010213_32460 [Microbacterium maritypicum]|uniref:Uncharacterized protein n=1 Tax=Microbacterium maritypicum TaxID=33918 RepID=A0A4Y4B8X7_MICMQ|nr:hypothetical protein MLI01_32200 [Microbacterium liquefaciens]GGV66309.1 hypothetical protein GCM10010213_32460 [Microbacterium liquefaciens]